MSRIISLTANRCHYGLNVVYSRVMPLVINNFRTKLICAVLAGLAVPQLVAAAPGDKSASSRASRSKASAAARSAQRAAKTSQPSSPGSMRKKLAESKSAGTPSGQPTPGRRKFGQPTPFPNGNTGINGSGQPQPGTQGGQPTPGRRKFGQPIPFPNGNTGINGSGQPDRVVPFPNGNTGINGSGQPTTGGRRPGRYFPSTGSEGQPTPPKSPRDRYIPRTGERPPMTT